MQIEMKVINNIRDVEISERVDYKEFFAILENINMEFNCTNKEELNSIFIVNDIIILIAPRYRSLRAS